MDALVLSLKVLFLIPAILTIGVDDQSFLDFPKDFKVGVSGSAYQTEGAWNISGKGESVWDYWTHRTNDFVIDQSNGDIACDSYKKYKEDIQITKIIGFNHYRFSLSWPRILPTGFSDNINEEGIQYYKNVLDELKEQGIEPFVTLYHWDHPQVIDELGGWMNSSMVEYFADYARVVFEKLGSRVKFWTTINEPNNYCNKAYGTGVYAPNIKLPGRGPYICAHNILKAHAEAYRIYDKEYRPSQNGTIGIVIPCRHDFPLHENDTESPEIGFQFDCGWIAHPIFSKNGDYPEVMKERILDNSNIEGLRQSRLPVFSPEEIKNIQGSSDYFGLNHYTSRMIEPVPRTKPKYLWYQDSGVKKSINQSWPVAASDWLRVVPEGIGGVLRKIKEEYDNPDVYICENGYSSTGSLNDYARIDFLYSYMKEVLLAVNRDGCNVKAYTVWSLLDNFEWDRGYTERFGIVHVNFTNPNRTRTPRLSAFWLKNVLKKKKLIKNSIKRFPEFSSIDESKN